jgi:hypothetical protein
MAWVFFVLYMMLRSVYRRTVRETLGILIVAIGVSICLIGIIGMWLGFDNAVAALNQDMAILPFVLSKIFGVAAHLGIPSNLPTILTLVGAGGMLGGWFLRSESIAGILTRPFNRIT